MQRLYSTFPSGWPGIGLLVLRTAIGVTLIIEASAGLLGLQDGGLVTGAVCLLALVSGGALVVGFLTPIASLLATLGGLGITLLSPASAAWNFFNANPLSVDMLAMALVCALLGPGKFSLDAQLFGRRKIIIPRSSHSSSSLTSSGLHNLGSSISQAPSAAPSRVPRSPASRPTQP